MGYCKYKSLALNISATFLLFAIHPKAGESQQSENKQWWWLLQEGLGTSHTLNLKINLKNRKGKERKVDWKKKTTTNQTNTKNPKTKNTEQVGENKRNCCAKRKSWWQKTSELQKDFQPLLSYLCTLCFLSASSCWCLSSAYHRKAIIVYWFFLLHHKITA